VAVTVLCSPPQRCIRGHVGVFVVTQWTGRVCVLSPLPMPVAPAATLSLVRAAESAQYDRVKHDMCDTTRCDGARLAPNAIATRQSTRGARLKGQTRVDDRGRDEDAAPARRRPDAPGAQAAHAHGGPVVTRTVHGDEAAAL
jgi:hypothetical protein